MIIGHNIFGSKYNVSRPIIIFHIIINFLLSNILIYFLIM
jgi:hypothetical protein